MNFLEKSVSIFLAKRGGVTNQSGSTEIFTSAPETKVSDNNTDTTSNNDTTSNTSAAPANATGNSANTTGKGDGGVDQLGASNAKEISSEPSSVKTHSVGSGAPVTLSDTNMSTLDVPVHEQGLEGKSLGELKLEAIAAAKMAIIEYLGWAGVTGDHLYKATEIAGELLDKHLGSNPSTVDIQNFSEKLNDRLHDDLAKQLRHEASLMTGNDPVLTPLLKASDLNATIETPSPAHVKSTSVESSPSKATSPFAGLVDLEKYKVLHVDHDHKSSAVHPSQLMALTPLVPNKAPARDGQFIT